MARTVTAAFRAAMESDSRSPRQLAIFDFPIAGHKLLSDQLQPTFGTYEPLIIEWGDLVDMAGGDPQKDQAGEIRQMSITIWNGGDEPFSDLFLVEQPENVLVHVYQWFDGLAVEDATLIDTFVVQDPIEYDESSTLLKLDLVSLSMRYDNPIGEVITTANYPLAAPEDIGKEIPVILGTPGEVPTFKIQVTPIATLDGSILEDTETITVKESLDDLGFPAIGRLEINEEYVIYQSRTEFTLTDLTRGAHQSEATEHITGVSVSLVSYRVFGICKGPINAVNNVYVAGNLADPADYEINRFADPAIVFFDGAPKAVSYATGATFLEMMFDDTNAENTAFQAWAAYEGEENLAARLTETESLLSVRQVTVNPDRGEIVKAFLAVEHWEDGSFLNDYAEISIEGIGVVGRLSRPSPEQTITIDAEVDIDHSHSHNISGEHTHTFEDPAIQLNDPTHGHSTTITIDTLYYPAQATNKTYYTSYGSWTKLDTFHFEFSPMSWDSGTFSISISIPFVTLEITLYVGRLSYGSYTVPTFKNTVWKGRLTSTGTYNIGIGKSPAPDDLLIVLINGYGGAYGASAFVGEMTFTAIRGADIAPSPTGTYVDVTQSGVNKIATDKATDDVQDLITDNIIISDIASDAASSTIVNLFDITSAVDFDWSWFTDRDITIEYIGTDDQRKIYIRHMFFDVEYRKKEIIFSDDVTCEPVGLIDDSSGTITGTPRKLITRPDEVRKYILINAGGLSAGYIDSNSFDAAGNSYTGLSYAFDGVLDGGLTVRDVEKKLAFQCRSRWFWNEGKAKIMLRNKVANMSAVKFLAQDDLQLRSIKAKRQRVTDISNVIDLQYNKDWTDTDQKPFIKIASGSDIDSIALNGNYEHRDKWAFDCVANDAMAADLLDYYLDTQATPSTFYTFNVYLSQFDLEKGDVIGLSSPFGKLIKALMEIKSVDRSFGSGRSKTINRLTITAESIRYALISIGLTDAVTVLEAITISFKDSLELADVAFVEEGVIFSITGNLAETVTVADVISTISNFVTVLSETVTMSEAAVHSVGLNISETQFVFDQIVPQLLIGFGGGEYGGVRFGGVSFISEILSELVIVSETFVTDHDTVFADILTTIDEQLVFSSGYGTPVGDGFGGALYGS